MVGRRGVATKGPLAVMLIACAMSHSAPALAQVKTDAPAISHALFPATVSDRLTTPDSVPAGPERLDAADLNSQPAEWRLTGVRRATPTGPGRVKEVEGALISDAVRREIRFKATEHTGFVVPYDRIDALHYEEAKYPQRFLRRSSFYLTVHYSDADGRQAFETIRVLSERDALSALATLERDTFSPTGRTGDCHVLRTAAAVAGVAGGLGP